MSDVMIEARSLGKTYGTVEALRDVSFEVPKGQVVGFLGPNGAGKTTTMKILTCFIAPTEGTAKVNGCDVFDDPIGVRTAIGYLPESTPLYTDMLTLEYLEFMSKMRGFRGDEARKRIKKAVEETGLGDVIGKEIRALSKGYRQRVGLAQALVHEPPILILDEPMSGLDPNQAVGIRDLIKEIGKERTVILSTHNLAEVQITCSRVLIIARGQLVADDSAEGIRSRAGRARYEVSFLSEHDGKSHSEAEVRELLGKVGGVDRVRPIGAGDNELAFEVTPTGDDDLRPELFRAAVDGSLTMVGLAQKAENLESVFRDLTTGESAPTASESAASGGNGKAEAKDEEPAEESRTDSEPPANQNASSGATEQKGA